MKEFKNKLKRRICITCMELLGVILLIIVLQSKVTNTNVRDFICGFNLGIAMAAVGISLFAIIKAIKALRNEEYLKKLYIEENDERTLLIQQKVSSIGGDFSNFALLFMTVIAGYFNETAFLTLLVALLITLLPKLVIKIYYFKKY